VPAGDADGARPLRVAFFGTPAFAVPTLERLLRGPHAVVAVVSQPDRPTGRGRRIEPTPVAAVARAHGLPLLQPERVGAAESEQALRDLRPDVGVVVAFGQFLTRRIRELPRLGLLVNAHASLLPRLRGAAPIARAILEGEPETGISVMRVDREMDAGPVAAVRRTPIGPEETAGELEARLAGIAAEAIAEVLDALAADRVRWQEQDASQATFAPKLLPEEAALDFAAPAHALARRIRAFAPRPGAWTRLGGERLRILAARAERADVDDPPGTLRLARGPVRIATRDGWLLPTALQRAGGRVLEPEAFARGARTLEGAQLG